MSTWDMSDANHTPNVLNVSSLTRADLQSRLKSGLPGHALFQNMPTTGTFMIDGCDQQHFNSGLEDERLAMFESNAYYSNDTWDTGIGTKGSRAAMLHPGIWTQNIASPGVFVPRDGGSHYRDAWTQAVAARGTVKHAYVESWNDYNEGEGIYAASAGPPLIVSGNPNTDTWSSTNDPYEYIKTTANGARQFNDIPDLGSTILWHNLPTTMRPGQTLTVQVIVRNDGDSSWTGAAGFEFGEKSSKDSTLFMSGFTLINDNDPANEIYQTQDYGYGSIQGYGGIFRGRPLTFDLTLTVPMTLGAYATHWGMAEGGTWFGGELLSQITVAVPEPSALALLATGLIGVLAWAWRKREWMSCGCKQPSMRARL